MQDITITSHALKEWATAINALESGKTIMLLRKGGIQEQGGRFQVAHEQILLYPTYEHQQPFLLKPDYANLVTPVTPGWHPETLRIGSWAEITDIFQVSDESIVKALEAFHIWSESFISDRLKWKQHQPLYVLLLRVYKLPQEWEIPYRQEYGGCKSWIDLEEVISRQGAQPVLPDSKYNEIVEEIRNIIGNKFYASQSG
ncbi:MULTISPECIES: DUF1802 family protein [Nostocales]|uniref:DUF1802 family protein n=3 Tax=Nostocales TaxID=1161 RepID=A0A0C1QS31_9CYAN|nr:DUF1802 family protein [Tolypothrix bouteillei]KAF3889997.1 DUF1802 family protein [Tolypothrix bouteillei VB521301]